MVLLKLYKSQHVKKKKSVAYNSSLRGVHSLHLPSGLCDLAPADLPNLLSSAVSALYAPAALTAVPIFSLLFCLLFHAPRAWKALEGSCDIELILTLSVPTWRSIPWCG